MPENEPNDNIITEYPLFHIKYIFKGSLKNLSYLRLVLHYIKADI